jgi:hypothetical protein
MASPVSWPVANKGLIGTRMALGLTMWTMPRKACKAVGIDVSGNPQSPYLARLFGARDLALATGVLGTEGDAQRQWLLAGLACDAADALATIAAALRGYLPKVTSAKLAATALGAAGLGVAALRNQ